MKKDSEIFSTRIWTIYKRNTENDLLSHKYIYIHLLVATIQTSGRSRSVQGSDIAQSKT